MLAFRYALEFGDVLEQNPADFDDALGVPVNVLVVGRDGDLRSDVFELGAGERDDAVPFAG